MGIMFDFEEPADLNDDWYLGDKGKHVEKISKEILESISNVHMVGIQYLFENYAKKRGGAILNEDEDLNMPLQICVFLSSVKERIGEKSPVLIITSEYSLCKWHYHTSEVGFKPHIMTSTKFEHSGIYILSSESLKLAVNLLDLDLDLFCVVIDDFDTLATKLLVKKLRGSYNIGLTTRNFYKHPDQKLKWSMLNWVSPGCVGKLNDFYRIDRLHSLAFSDNYRFWWKRLTWKFCDSFNPPNEEDLKEYQQKLKEWGDFHNIKLYCNTKTGIKRTRDKKQPTRKKTRRPEAEDADITLHSSDSTSPTPSPFYDLSVKTENLIQNPKELLEEDAEDNPCYFAKSVKTEPAELTKDVESDDSEIFQLSTEIRFKDESSNNKLTKNDELEPIDNRLVKRVKTEITEHIGSIEDEPTLSVIYCRKALDTHTTSPGRSSNISQSIEKNSKFLSFLDGESSNESQSYQQISNVIDKLSDEEVNTETDSDSDSFFSKLIKRK